MKSNYYIQINYLSDRILVTVIDCDCDVSSAYAQLYRTYIYTVQEFTHILEMSVRQQWIGQQDQEAQIQELDNLIKRKKIEIFDEDSNNIEDIVNYLDVIIPETEIVNYIDISFDIRHSMYGIKYIDIINTSTKEIIQSHFYFREHLIQNINYLIQDGQISKEKEKEAFYFILYCEMPSIKILSN